MKGKKAASQALSDTVRTLVAIRGKSYYATSNQIDFELQGHRNSVIVPKSDSDVIDKTIRKKMRDVLSEEKEVSDRPQS